LAWLILPEVYRVGLRKDEVVRVLTGNQPPDYSEIGSFAAAALRPLSEIFVQILPLCQRAGMVRR
jgi:hypothetical protein